MSVSRPKSAHTQGFAAWVVAVGLLLAAFWWPAHAVAVTVSGLYSVEVPVDGSSQEELEKGYADGLAKVFVRVSGTRDVLSAEGLDAVLADAESLLLSYQFLRGEDDKNSLRMSFGAVGVNRALASIEAPVWGANRPLTLAWVAVEDRGSRTLITESAASGNQGVAGTWQSAFNEAALDRGLPVELPPENFSGDRELLSDIWGQFIGRVRGVSENLEHDVLALVRISRSGGEWRAGWVFDGMAMAGGEESVMASTPEALAQAVVNRWAESYASRYAVAAAEVGESPQVDIVLRGVSSLEDYGQVSKALEGLTPVVSAGPSKVKGDQLTMRVAFSGELDQLKEYIALDPRFVPLESEPRVGGRDTPEQPPVPLAPAVNLDEPTEPEPVSGAESLPLFTYEPLPVDREEAEQAFESLYQVLYYRWQPASVVSDGGRQ